ncbi:sigma-70 family RNA polymerase sigma factor [Turicibacter sanguinis]|uniref:sigma-70 family RNA polymerase sigma factor n=1 Tax=Turicibacter sanguinis TaxID=154288 RepID=UPI0012BBD0FA|nr:sigma-70 family RNA polymerase sigma factor [Turicibacter sanguinis]MDB8566646.1 sigma-70 family RNA polymerase sigma factor [Turicibacter sanguinis]MDB8569449.1 sigma-70 family RNA polymerase sigma factor [Turicibacter sanguinis]MDB8572199.1 sigma-70 family RNA polymerase sigma factor [Turicibacter sanguinis]MDB8580841.1 sigma-70 family RNA polymerase sigma factor [Turicibacter sanguinis]MTO09332.1 sigma-70 family RNA polymerase sigma factor [Turicibacter sanguinis]
MDRVLVIPWVKKVEEVSERQLAKKAIRGDHDAYGELLKRHKAYFYKMAFSYVREQQVALDIVGEMTYLGLMKIHQLKNPDYFKTWMTKILIHVALKEIKKQQDVMPLLDQVDIQEVNKGISIEQKLDLYEAMDRLRPEYKMVIILKFFNDYKEKEIADLMELPLNTVKSHLRRAKEELNVLLKGGCFNE